MPKKAKRAITDGVVQQLGEPDPTKFYRWIVEFGVNAVWVADGFDLDDERAMDMLQHHLGYAREDELRAKVHFAPNPVDVRLEQGERVPKQEYAHAMKEEERWPMTRNEVKAHAEAVAQTIIDLFVDRLPHGGPRDFAKARVASIAELAMCKAAGLPWGSKPLPTGVPKRDWCIFEDCDQEPTPDSVYCAGHLEQEKQERAKQNWCRKLDDPHGRDRTKGRAILSRDPRKAKIVAALKAATGATSITMVKEVIGTSPPRYRGHCFRKMQEWDGAGYYEIQLGNES
jgi:hypothetical protein